MALRGKGKMFKISVDGYICHREWLLVRTAKLVQDPLGQCSPVFCSDQSNNFVPQIDFHQLLYSQMTLQSMGYVGESTCCCACCVLTQQADGQYCRTSPWRQELQTIHSYNLLQCRSTHICRKLLSASQ